MRGIDRDSLARERQKWIAPELDRWLEKLDLGEASRRARDVWMSVKEGGTVIVYGDYDVDGIASTTFMMDLAMRRASKTRYYIPHRNDQGYGFHSGVVDAIAKSGCRCDLLVVVDCGTQNIEAVERAKAHGIPVIIFDHHLAREDVALADALVNPHIDGDDMAKKLCAAGVVWCWAWKNDIAPREWLIKKLDVVALATIADCVSLESPLNRAMTRTGIGSIKTHPRNGIAALMRGIGLECASVDTDSLAMKIIPCLNAAGRLEFADLAMRLFFPSGSIDEHAETLVALNQKRRALSAKIVDDIDRSARSGSRYDHVLYGEDWPPGVLSSVASNICSSRDMPVVLAAPTKKGMIRGTLRVPNGVDAEAILTEISDKLVSWGGHRMAAGFSVQRDDWSNVREILEELLSSVRPEPEPENVLRWDPSMLDLSSWHEAEKIGPFGIGNPYPRLFCPHSGRIDWEPLGRKGGHIKIRENGCELLAFGGENLCSSKEVHNGWIYRPRTNFWRSSESLQFVVEKAVISGQGV